MGSSVAGEVFGIYVGTELRVRLLLLFLGIQYISNPPLQGIVVIILSAEVILMIEVATWVQTTIQL